MIRCEKWHGAGNDFLVAAERDGTPPAGWSEWARRFCDRRFGIGADGLLVLQEADGVQMGYWNADGSRAEMCGNGGRVLAAFLASRGGTASAPRQAPARVQFRSPWGQHDAAVQADGPHRFTVDLTLPDVPAPAPRTVTAPWGAVDALFVTAGVPHLVVRRSDTPATDLAAVPVAEWGRALRRLELPGGAGANVDFLEAEPDGGLRLRTYERGVEGETLACGTGALAAAAAAVHWQLGAAPFRVTPWSGVPLQVDLRVVAGALTSVHLRGPAVRVARIEAVPS